MKKGSSPRKDRMEMVQDLRRRGIVDERVLEALLKVPRHLFVDERFWDVAYGDHPLPIGGGQTISQPYIVALMTQALKLQKENKVLEIGTGSGYQTAILAELAREVFTIDRSEELTTKAQELLESANYTNIHCRVGDGTVGWAEHAPYDGIIGTGSVPEVPPSLIAQLGNPGRLVIPIGGRHVQELLLLEKSGDESIRKELCPCSFLPLIGEQGWREDEY